MRFAGFPEQGCTKRKDEFVAGSLGRMTSSCSSAGACEDTSISDEETSAPQIGYFLESQAQPAECDPQDSEDVQLYNGVVRQESAPDGVGGQELALPDLSFRIEVIPSFQMHKILSQMSCTRQLIATYCKFRQLLGNSVQKSHIAWARLKAENQHPLLKVAGLAFGVISTPETASYMEDQWDQLREQFMPHSPEYIMAQAMKDYALAWAYRPQDLQKAFKIVKAFYDDMENGDPTNFFLAPCYTVTIGGWIYDANLECNTLSFPVIGTVEKYADKALRQIRNLTDEWARIDTFGMRVNALQLFLRVRKFYAATSCSTETLRLERKIDDVLEGLHQYESHPKITKYDKAGFYSVRKMYYERENIAEYHRCATIAAKFYRDNGRIKRAQEEAKLSGSVDLVRDISKEAQDVPFE